MGQKTSDEVVVGSRGPDLLLPRGSRWHLPQPWVLTTALIVLAVIVHLWILVIDGILVSLILAHRLIWRPTVVNTEGIDQAHWRWKPAVHTDWDNVSEVLRPGPSPSFVSVATTDGTVMPLSDIRVFYQDRVAKIGRKPIQALERPTNPVPGPPPAPRRHPPIVQ